MFKPETPYTKIAYYTIKHQLLGGEKHPLSHFEIPVDLFHIKRGCFVSLHTVDDALRGCIGTVEPAAKNLVEEIRRNALSAAFHDPRFSPLSTDEFNDITLSVDVLTTPQPVTDLDELDPAIYGLIVSDGKSNRGVLLPSIPGIDTPEKQIRIVKEKANLARVENHRLLFFRFTSNRYH